MDTINDDDPFRALRSMSENRQGPTEEDEAGRPFPPIEAYAADLRDASPAGPSAGDADPIGREFFCAASLAGHPVPPRPWHVPGLIPAGNVTLLGGDGGTGKSLLALQLAVATALGRSWIGRAVTAGGALYVSAEDDRDELHRRLADIARAETFEIADLDALTLLSLADTDALLAGLDPRNGIMRSSPLYNDLDARFAEEEPALLVLDTLADMFPGKEIDRAQTRHFIGLLRRLAIRHDIAVLLLAHPSLTGLNSGSGTSGSTAWSNSVRSRLYLERIKEDGYEADPDARVLRTMKSNYGPTGGEVALRWQDGVFVAQGGETALDRMAVGMKAERVFLSLLRQFTEQGRYVSSQPGPTYAPTIFAANPGAEGCNKRVLRTAMEALFANGRIKTGEHGKGVKVRSHIEEVRGNG